MRIMLIGDVVGKPGRRVVKRALRHLRTVHDPDLVIVNGENCAHGAGITPACADELYRAGCNVITGGNHTWDRKEALACLESDPRVLRPANYPDDTPGSGVGIYTTGNGESVAVINLQGRIFMEAIDDPFRIADMILHEISDDVKVRIVDFHAEATSEKVAMGWYLDGRVTAVVGTHTHVATADARVLPEGTAYITDVGMSGPHDSVIGVEKEIILKRFLTQRPVRFAIAEGDLRLSSVLIDADPDTGRAVSIKRVVFPEED